MAPPPDMPVAEGDPTSLLHQFMGTFIHELQARTIPWTLENPTDACVWEQQCFTYAIAHGLFVDCHACAFGSGQKLPTTFLVSHHQFSVLARLCDGTHAHASQQTGDKAKDFEYPSLLCQDYAAALNSIAAAAHLFPAQHASAKSRIRPQIQTRGRAVPQIIPEYLRVESLCLAAVPPTDAKQRLVNPCQHIPIGSKLLRSEAKWGTCLEPRFLCVFGVYRSPSEFVDVARQLWHPFDELHNLPDSMIRVLFKHLTSSPWEITRLRIETLERWTRIARSLLPLEADLHDTMHPSVRQILAPKRILLMKEIAHEIQWPDTELFDELIAGFRLVGNATPSNVFKRGITLASLSEEQLAANTKVLRPAILGRLRLAANNVHQKELFDITMSEASEKPWLEGPYSPAQVTERLGPSWLPVRRFAIAQKGKLRAIDDFKENTLNCTFASVEKVELRTMDNVLWSLLVLIRYMLHCHDVHFTLSMGEVLTGKVHPEWKRAEVSFRTTCVDLKSAYKQLPLSPKEQHRTVVSMWNPYEGQPACFLLRVLPFGASASVHHFLRVSAFLQAAGLHMGLCWASYFDDFVTVSHKYHEQSSLAAALGLFKLLGFACSEDKLKPFACSSEMLGVDLDAGESPKGIIKVRNRPTRTAELVTLLEKFLDTKTLEPASLPSALGRLQFAEAQIWGRAGRLALSDLRSFEKSSSRQVQLDRRAEVAIKMLRDKLASGKPRTLMALPKVKPFVLFTDGALEYDVDGLAVASIGAVLMSPTGEVLVFGARVPPTVLKAWQVDGKVHVVGLIELYALLVAVKTWGHLWENQRVICFTDSWPVFDVVVRGNSKEPVWRDLLLVLENLEERNPTMLWMARVPSASNPADFPSRGDVQPLSFLRPFKVDQASCPISDSTLASTI